MSDKMAETPDFDTTMADLLGYNPVWYWIMSFIILGTIMLTAFFLLKLRNKDAVIPPAQEKKKTPAHLVSDIDKAFLLVSNRAISIQEACQRVSITLREFLQFQTGLPAESMTITELQKAHAPAQIIAAIGYIYPIVFGNKQIATYDEFLRFMDSSRAIVDGRWK